MNTVQLALWAKHKIQSEAWEEDKDNPDSDIRSIGLGSVYSLDPCGRFHHMLSPNGVTNRCIAYWESLEKQLEKRGMSLESNDGEYYLASEYRDKEVGDEVRED